jgi:hypothetical protein
VYLEELLRQLPAYPRRTRVGTHDVSPSQIIGTVGPRPDYDADFVPRDGRLREAWNEARETVVPNGAAQPVDLVELGGCYFVRSGVEAVSVAKLHLVQELPARVERYESPVNLPPSMDRRKVPVFRSKVQFEMTTGVFGHISQDSFRAVRSRTWDILADSVLDRRTGAPSPVIAGPRPNRDAILRWYESIYASIARYVAESCLALTMQDSHDSDIVADVLRYWRGCPPYTSLSEAFNQFADRIRNRNAVVHHLRRLVPGETARTRFLRVSRLEQYAPNALLPFGSDRWYRYLTDQLAGLAGGGLRERLGRHPNMRELVTVWYDTILRPAYAVYQQESHRSSFPRLYVRWIESEHQLHTYLASRTNGVRKRLQDSFAHYLQKT